MCFAVYKATACVMSLKIRRIFNKRDRIDIADVCDSTVNAWILQVQVVKQMLWQLS